jgi:3-dehydroquinate synthase
MRTIKVKASRKYNVIIGAGLLERAGAHIKNAAGGNSAAIVTDDNIAGLYLDELVRALRRVDYETAVFTIKNGEASKNTRNYVRLLEFLAEKGFTRTDIVVALGGGVVGDLAGFAAASYLRGIPYVQVPTTLLAAVDSSVGGKTAIDLDAGKNLAGAFYQPGLVLCDCDVIEALPPNIFVDGCAEVIKCGMIADKELFKMMGEEAQSDLEEIIARCVEIKSSIVREDEFETSTRKLLNFGHTVGHAIEKLSNYNVSHGKAVAIGMAVETLAAVKLGKCGIECYNDLVELLHKYGLPYSTRFNASELSRAAMSDKKRSGGKITLIFPEEVGICNLQEVNIQELERIIGLGNAGNATQVVR